MRDKKSTETLILFIPYLRFGVIWTVADSPYCLCLSLHAKPFSGTPYWIKFGLKKGTIRHPSPMEARVRLPSWLKKKTTPNLDLFILFYFF